MAAESHRIDAVAPLSAAGRIVALSSRQREVLVRVAAGRTNAEIAHELAISPRTVRMHCDALKVKLGVRKRRLIPAAYRAITGQDPFLEAEPQASSRARTT
jgi:DNA-binding CsgD family transcriptional regulator